MAGKPVISVIIVTYNRLRFLKECLKALREQTLEKDAYEVIVVDDGSKDGTRDYLKTLDWKRGPALSYYLNDHKGATAGRNFGVSKSKARYVSFTDDDCVPESDWLKKVLESFEDRDDIDIVGSVTRVNFDNKAFDGFSRNGKQDGNQIKDERKTEIIDGNVGFVGLRPFSLCNLHIKRETFKELGSLDESLWPAEDIDLLCKFFKAKKKALHRKDIYVDHFERNDFRSMFKRWFVFGRNDTMMLKRHYSSSLVIETDIFHGLFKQAQFIVPFPFGLYFQLNLFKLFLIFLGLAFLVPPIGILLLILLPLSFFLKQKNLKATAGFLLYSFITQANYALGALVGSFQNKVVSI